MTRSVEAMGAMVLLLICDSSFACEDYNTYRAYPWSPFPLRRAHPGPGPQTEGGDSDLYMCAPPFTDLKVESKHGFRATWVPRTEETAPQ